MFRALAVVIIIASMSTSGCVVLTGTVYRVEEPLEDEFVDVVSVDGTTLVLADGRRRELVGIRPGASKKMIETLEDRLRGMLVGRSRVLLFEEEGGVRAEISIRDPQGFRNPMAIVLFPTVQIMPARREDVGLDLITSGVGEAVPTEIMDEVRRKAYVDAEAEARARKFGIWAAEENSVNEERENK